MSVPAYKIETPGAVGSLASTAKAFTGMSGMPFAVLPIAVQVGVAEFKLVVRHILPAVEGLV